MNPKIVSAEFTSLRPRVDKKYADLVPKVTTPMQARVHIKNIRAAEANAIRRVILNELPVFILHAEYEDIETDDAYPIGEMLQGAINRIPIKQTARDGAKYTLEIKNDSADPRYVTAGDFKGPDAGSLFNSEFILLSLNPGCFIRITARVIQVKGYKGVSEQVGVLACQGTIIPWNGTGPVNMYDRYIPLDPNEPDPIKADSARGERSSVSDVHEYILMFKTLGTLPPRDICVAAAENIIERLEIAKAAAVAREGAEYAFTLDDESMTLGTLIMRHALDVDFTSNLTARALTNARAVEVRFRLGTEYDDGAKFIGAVCASATKYFAALAKEFAAMKNA